MLLWIPVDLMIGGVKMLWRTNKYARAAVIAAGTLFVFMVLYDMFNPAAAAHDEFTEGRKVFTYSWCRTMPDAEAALQAMISGEYREYIFSRENSCFDIMLMNLPMFAIEVVKHMSFVASPAGDFVWSLMEVKSPKTGLIGYSWIMHVEPGRAA
jgi:hypothetical protein